MHTVGLRELRQQASDLIREVEAGEEVTITVNGRPAARLVPMQRRKTWCTFGEIRELFDLPPVTGWESDRDLIDQAITDPWERER